MSTLQVSRARKSRGRWRGVVAGLVGLATLTCASITGAHEAGAAGTSWSVSKELADSCKTENGTIAGSVSKVSCKKGTVDVASAASYRTNTTTTIYEYSVNGSSSANCPCTVARTEKPAAGEHHGDDGRGVATNTTTPPAVTVATPVNTYIPIVCSSYASDSTGGSSSKCQRDAAYGQMGDIFDLQVDLSCIGYTVWIDGSWGPSTQRAIDSYTLANPKALEAAGMHAGDRVTTINMEHDGFKHVGIRHQIGSQCPDKTRREIGSKAEQRIDAEIAAKAAAEPKADTGFHFNPSTGEIIFGGVVLTAAACAAIPGCGAALWTVVKFVIPPWW